MARTRGRRTRDEDNPGTTDVRRRRDLLSEARAAAEHNRRLRAEADALLQTQQALWEANQRFSDLYDFVPIPYLIVSNLGIIQHINQAALEMLGAEREWAIGRPLIGYVETADMRRVLDSVLSSSQGFSQSLEVRVRAKDGVRTVQMITGRRVRDAQTRATFHIALVDVTETRRLENERRHAEYQRRKSQEAERVAKAASAAKDEFLAMLSHELRTPLTPILSAADALVAHGALSPELIARLEIIRRNVKAEARLIDDLLDVARITRDKLEIARRPLDLHTVVREIVDAWRGPIGQHRLRLEVLLAASAHRVRGDADRLGQVFRNIISNAVKFSEAGGRIEVRSEDHASGVRVTVRDTGSGMTSAQMERLFQPFVGRKDTAPRHGLGLGLVISHAIVGAHGGTLAVSSAGPGKGTTVCVDLPTIAPGADAGTPGLPAVSGVEGNPGTHERASDLPAVAASGTTPTAKILLVEDDPDSAEMLALLLSSEGFEVQTARSLRHARMLAPYCEILVSDIALPDGSGLELIRAIRKEKPMRGIALSGYGSRQDIERSLEAGFEEHLTKPVDLERLVAAVRRLAVPKA